MKNNIFKTIRGSYKVCALLTSMLSFSVAIGQSAVQYCYAVKENNTYPKLYKDYYPALTERSQEVGPLDTELSSNINRVNTNEDSSTLLVNKNNYSETQIVFKPLEKQVVVGSILATESDNPLDNMFTVYLPDTLQLDKYKPVLSYSLYGLSSASQTTKSINHEPAYGGRVINLTDKWVKTEETLPIQQLLPGRNEIYFTRITDRQYEYQIKDVELLMVPIENTTNNSSDVSAFLYDEQVYLTGSIDDVNVKSLEVNGHTFEVDNGVIEGILENISKENLSLKGYYILKSGEKSPVEISKKVSANHTDIIISPKYKTIARPFYLNDEKVEVSTGLAIETECTANVAVRGLLFKDLRLINHDIVNVTAGDYVGYRVNKLEGSDSASLKLHLGFDPDKIPTGYTQKDVRTFFYDTETNQWSQLYTDSLDYEHNKLITEYNGDTDYINGVIKVPEMAETSSFVPTSISGMEYANPTAGIVSIPPPSPNSTGSATTSFPIKIPAGRNGMQPSLSVNYNSDGGNGWMGMGWNLQLPAITLNTKWGAPRFDSAKETEMYLLNGEELLLDKSSPPQEPFYTTPNRTDGIARTSNRIFYLRKEGSYLMIQRKGTNPTNYCWVVTDKQGNTSYYGGVNSVSETQVIRADDNNPNTTDNIFHWALTRTVDTYGNCVNYYYYSGTDNVNGVPAKVFYPSQIQYSLKYGTTLPTYYRVSFRRNMNSTFGLQSYTVGTSSTYNRPDPVISGRNGGLQYINQVLTEIWVDLYDNGTVKPIRKYRFNYAPKAFGKTMLTEIAEYSPNTPSTSQYTLFYTNTIEYFDEIGSTSANPSLYNSSAGWTAAGSSPGDNIGIPLSGIDQLAYEQTIPTGSVLGTSTSSGWAFGMRVGAGLGTSYTSLDKSVGASFNYSKNTSDNKISFLDINGDGLPDKVFRSGNNIRYRKNTGNGFTNAIYNLNAISELSRTRSQTTSWGGSAFYYATIGGNVSKTRSKTDGYFMDYNGDGLADMILDGKVHFNTGDPAINHRTFTTNVNSTENIISSGTIDPSIINDLELPSLIEVREELPQFDAIKVWQAPYTGTINITSTVGLISENPNGANGTVPNNFKFTIERASEQDTSAEVLNTLNVNSPTPSPTSFDQSNESINKGDYIFFRAHNMEDGSGGTIEWNPVINYTTSSETPYNYVDENGKTISHFDITEDFLLSGASAFQAGGGSGSTSASVNFNLLSSQYNTANLYTDDVIFKITKVREYADSEAHPNVITSGSIWQATYNHKTGGLTYSPSSNPSISLNSYVDDNSDNNNDDSSYTEVLYFSVESTSNVSWENIGWQPKVTVNSELYYPEVSYKVYNDKQGNFSYKISSSNLPLPQIITSPINNSTDPLLIVSQNLSSSGSLNTAALNNVPASEFPIPIHLVVKKEFANTGIIQTLKKQTYTINRVVSGSNVTYNVSPSSSLTLTRGDINNTANIFVAFYSPYQNVTSLFSSTRKITLTLANGVSQTWGPVQISNPFFVKSPNIFGQPYRGWGQFLYNGSIKLQHDGVTNEVTNTTPDPDFGAHAIDMTVFSVNGDYTNLQTQLEALNQSTNVTSAFSLDAIPRYAFYSMDNDKGVYTNISILESYDESTDVYDPIIYGYDNGGLQTTLGRFGENSVYNVYIDESILETPESGVFLGLKQYSISRGHGAMVGFSKASVQESWSTTRVLNQYMDMNGDSYPDLITSGKIQYTNALGAFFQSLANEGGFVITNEGYDFSKGYSTFVKDPPNSTSSSNAANSGSSNSNLDTTETGGTSNTSSKTSLNRGGFNENYGTSEDKKLLVDMNGDGLPDQVSLYSDKLYVKLNLGYKFSGEIIWGSVPSIKSSNNVNHSVEVGSESANLVQSDDPKGYGSWSIGLGFNLSSARRQSMLQDINGDGLPDWLFLVGGDVLGLFDGTIKYYLNTGKGFDGVAKTLYSDIQIDEEQSFGGNISGTFTIGFPIFYNIKLVLTPSASAPVSFSSKKSMISDINGDGYVDLLYRGSNNSELDVNLSKIGKTNLLKKVNTPLGGSWAIDYGRTGNTYDMPHSKYVLSKITTYDGFTADNAYGLDETLTKVSYESPKYDRREREFLGFKKVKVDQCYPGNEDVYRYTVMEYHNNNVYLSGLLKQSYLFTGSDELLSTSRTFYNLMDPNNPVVNFNVSEENNYLQTTLNESLLDRSRLFVAPVKTLTYSYENGQALSTEEQFQYDAHGNVEFYKNLGDTSAASGTMGGDAFVTQITYLPQTQYNIPNGYGFPQNIIVQRLQDGQTMRQRDAEYNNKGKISKVITYLNESEVNQVSMAYDTYGNLERINYLDNDDGNGNYYYQQYTYDNVVHTYPVETTNALGYTSEATYDYLFGVPVLVKDINEQEMRTRIDSRGRVVEVTAPNEMLIDGWTIRMQYEGQAAPTDNGSTSILPATGSFTAATTLPTGSQHFAATWHNMYQNGAYTKLPTVSIVDGLGSAIQIKKPIFSGNLIWLISAKEKKDEFGRVIASYQLGSANIGDFNGLDTTDKQYNASSFSNAIVSYKYDHRDRIIEMKQLATVDTGEETPTITEYGIEEGMFTTTTSKQMDNWAQTFKTFTDTRGRQRKTIQNDELITRFYYNAIGELMTVKDHQGYETKYVYDWAGRTLETRHPDRGLQVFTYDKASRLTSSTNSNLISAVGGPQSILYEYKYNQLEQITYPDDTTVTYEYGIHGDSYAESQHAVGRLLKQTDASGIQTFGYDRLGNVSSQLRSVSVAGRHSFWFHTGWVYDSFNRIQSIEYPDGEVVSYKYNGGGALKEVVRSIPNVAGNEFLVSGITYNLLGERTNQQYGSGATTQYGYDTQRRLSEVTFNLGSNNAALNITKKYVYDEQNNIIQLYTDAPGNTLPGAGRLGGPAEHLYSYDRYNRLTSASGTYTGPNDATGTGGPYLVQKYTLNMEYDLNHNIISKTQTHIQGSVNAYAAAITNPQTVTKTNYRLEYDGYATGAFVTPDPAGGDEFGYVQPHAPCEIVEVPSENCCAETSPQYKKTLIQYDANGNELSVKQIVGTEEEGSETEEMALHRNLWDYENQLRAVDLNPDETTPHPLAVYTYDAGGQRVVRYTPGRLDAYSNGNKVSNNEWDAVMLYPSSMVTARAISTPGTAPQNGQSVVYYTKHYYIGAERIASTIGTKKDLGLYPSDFDNTYYTGLRTEADENVDDASYALMATYTQLGQTLNLPSTPREGSTTHNSGHSNVLLDTYYYHSDHLGSSSYISNKNKGISQHMEYMPFGELLVDEHLNSYNSPFKFNGKELDDETGNYYYGARYYNPKTSIWLSVDPLADKYPGWSPYNYCMLNPVILTDPDGLSPLMARWPPTWSDISGGIWKGTKNFAINTVKGLATPPAVTIYKVTSAAVKGNVKPAAEILAPSISKTDKAISFYQDVKNGNYENATATLTEEGWNVAAALGAEKVFNSVLGESKAVSTVETNTIKGAKVDLMGGKIGTPGYINFDLQAINGIADDISNFSQYFGSNSIEDLLVNNPQVNFLEEITPSVRAGGTVTVRGTISNKFFKSIYNGKASGLENYDVISTRQNLSNEGYYRTDGTPIGGQNNIYEITLQKK